MRREQKVVFVGEMRKSLGGMGVLVVARYSGLSVAQLTQLRVSMRESKGFLRVAKNRLVKIAIQGTEFRDVSAFLAGQTIMGFSEDPMVAPKVMADFSESNPGFELVGAVLDGSVLDAASVLRLAKMPSLSTLRSGFLRLIQGPLARLVRVTGEPGARLARLAAVYAERSGERRSS